MTQSEISLFAAQLDELAGRAARTPRSPHRRGRRSARSSSVVADGCQRGHSRPYSVSPQGDESVRAPSPEVEAATAAAMRSCNSFNRYRLSKVIPPMPGRGTWEDGDNLGDLDPTLGYQAQAASDAGALLEVMQSAMQRLHYDPRRQSPSSPPLSTAQLVALLNARTTSAGLTTYSTSEGQANTTARQSVDECNGSEMPASRLSAPHEVEAISRPCFSPVSAQARKADYEETAERTRAFTEGFLELAGNAHRPFLPKQQIESQESLIPPEGYSPSLSDVLSPLGSASFEYPFSPKTPVSAAIATDIAEDYTRASAVQQAASVEAARDALGEAVFREAVADVVAEQEERKLLEVLLHQAKQAVLVEQELETLRDRQRLLVQQQEQLQLQSVLHEKEGEVNRVFAQLEKERQMVHMQYQHVLRERAELEQERRELELKAGYRSPTSPQEQIPRGEELTEQSGHSSPSLREAEPLKEATEYTGGQVSAQQDKSSLSPSGDRTTAPRSPPKLPAKPSMSVSACASPSEVTDSSPPSLGLPAPSLSPAAHMTLPGVFLDVSRHANPLHGSSAKLSTDVLRPASPASTEYRAPAGGDGAQDAVSSGVSRSLKVPPVPPSTGSSRVRFVMVSNPKNAAMLRSSSVHPACSPSTGSVGAVNTVPRESRSVHRTRRSSHSSSPTLEKEETSAWSPPWRLFGQACCERAPSTATPSSTINKGSAQLRARSSPVPAEVSAAPANANLSAVAVSHIRGGTGSDSTRPVSPSGISFSQGPAKAQRVYGRPPESPNTPLGDGPCRFPSKSTEIRYLASPAPVISPASTLPITSWYQSPQLIGTSSFHPGERVISTYSYTLPTSPLSAPSLPGSTTTYVRTAGPGYMPYTFPTPASTYAALIVPETAPVLGAPAGETEPASSLNPPFAQRQAGASSPGQNTPSIPGASVFAEEFSSEKPQGALVSSYSRKSQRCSSVEQQRTTSEHGAKVLGMDAAADRALGFPKREEKERVKVCGDPTNNPSSFSSIPTVAPSADVWTPSTITTRYCYSPFPPEPTCLPADQAVDAEVKPAFSHPPPPGGGAFFVSPGREKSSLSADLVTGEGAKEGGDDRRVRGRSTSPTRGEKKGGEIKGTEGWVKFGSAGEDEFREQEEDETYLSLRVLELRKQRQELEQQRQALVREQLLRDKREQERLKKQEEEELRLLLLERESFSRRARGGGGGGGSPQKKNTESVTPASYKVCVTPPPKAPPEMPPRHNIARVSTQSVTMTRSPSPSSSAPQQVAGPALPEGAEKRMTFRVSSPCCEWTTEHILVGDGVQKSTEEENEKSRKERACDLGTQKGAASASAVVASLAGEAARTAARRAAESVQEVAAAVWQPLQPVQEKLQKWFSSRAAPRKEAYRTYVLPPQQRPPISTTTTYWYHPLPGSIQTSPVIGNTPAVLMSPYQYTPSAVVGGGGVYQ